MVVKYYSEVLDKLFNSVSELETAEAEFQKAKDEEAKKIKEKEAFSKAVMDKFNIATDAMVDCIDCVTEFYIKYKHFPKELESEACKQNTSSTKLSDFILNFF